MPEQQNILSIENDSGCDHARVVNKQKNEYFPLVLNNLHVIMHILLLTSDRKKYGYNHLGFNVTLETCLGAIIATQYLKRILVVKCV